MSFTLSWRESALKDLSNFDIILRKRIVKKIIEFTNSELFHGVRRLQGYNNLYRLRVGDYRVNFEIIKEKIVILKIGHRKNIH